MTLLSDISCATLMLNPQKTLEREAMLKRIRELDADIAQHVFRPANLTFAARLCRRSAVSPAAIIALSDSKYVDTPHAPLATSA